MVESGYPVDIITMRPVTDICGVAVVNIVDGAIVDHALVHECWKLLLM